ncbi:hypothetical protein SR882_11140 [Guyparkeria halophila]|uniref:Glycosyltransferase family 2 protein n=1 Tax=Guyparkeria halophila TaxID=47960 RepID=A0ABZ0YYD8_9GAMM|nr:hypothetical protein [Guyparkeria halophila]WQH16292.1 hypothetical protein SR882_11140 [Guyparkeria halophila]
MNGPQGITVGLGVLSWKAPRTLSQTLATYADGDLFSLFDDCRILFQEISDQDREVAEAFGLPASGTASNIGIFGGVRALVEEVECDYVLLLENDCPLIEPHDEAARQLSTALHDAEELGIPVFRFRSLASPGQDFATLGKFCRYFGDRVPSGSADGAWGSRIRRWVRPRKARRLQGIAAYAMPYPERAFPGVFRRTKRGNLVTASPYLNWTNQSILVRRDWMLNVILPYVEAHPSSRLVNGFSDIEKELNRPWWRKQRFPVGLPPGLFTHERVDR